MLILIVQNKISENKFSYDCGDLLVNIAGQFSITVIPGATTANLAGTANIVMYTEYCGKITGKIEYSGNLTQL